jgi:hypothetical protein
MRSISPILRRVLIGSTLTIAFLVMASIFVPEFSRADSDGSGRGTIEAEASTDPHFGFVAIGTIEDDQFRVEVYGGGDQPRYTVYDATDGRELGVLMTAEEVAAWFPDLPLPEMDFDTDGAMMLAEPITRAE